MQTFPLNHIHKINWWRFAMWLCVIIGTMVKHNQTPYTATGSEQLTEEFEIGRRVLWAVGWFCFALALLLTRIRRVVNAYNLKAPVRTSVAWNIAQPFLILLGILLITVARDPSNIQWCGFIIRHYNGFATILGVVFIFGYKGVMDYRLAVVRTLQHHGKWLGEEEVNYGGIGGFVVLSAFAMNWVLGSQFLLYGQNGFHLLQIPLIIGVFGVSAFIVFGLDPTVDGLNGPPPHEYFADIDLLKIGNSHEYHFVTRVLIWMARKIMPLILIIGPGLIVTWLPEYTVNRVSRFIGYPGVEFPSDRLLLGIYSYILSGTLTIVFLIWNAAWVRGMRMLSLMRLMISVAVRAKQFRSSMMMALSVCVLSVTLTLIFPNFRMYVFLALILSCAAVIHQLYPPSILFLGPSTESVGQSLHATQWAFLQSRVVALMPPERVAHMYLNPERENFRTLHFKEWTKQVEALANISSLIVLDAREEPTEPVVWEVNFLKTSPHLDKTVWVGNVDGSAPCLKWLRPEERKHIVPVQHLRKYLQILRKRKFEAF